MLIHSYDQIFLYLLCNKILKILFKLCYREQRKNNYSIILCKKNQENETIQITTDAERVHRRLKTLPCKSQFIPWSYIWFPLVLQEKFTTGEYTTKNTPWLQKSMSQKPCRVRERVWERERNKKRKEGEREETNLVHTYRLSIENYLYRFQVTTVFKECQENKDWGVRNMHKGVRKNSMIGGVLSLNIQILWSLSDSATLDL